MMRKAILAGLVLSTLALTAVRAAAPDDQKFFDAHIDKLVTLKLKEVTSPALPKIFDARFFSVDVVVNDGWTTLLVARQGDALFQVTIPSSDGDIPDFKKLIKPAFILKSDDDGHAFQEGLDLLYPVTDQADIAVKTVKHTGNTFTFIRGKFFDHFKAFVMTTDDGGKITSIKWSLNS